MRHKNVNMPINEPELELLPSQMPHSHVGPLQSLQRRLRMLQHVQLRTPRGAVIWLGRKTPTVSPVAK